MILVDFMIIGAQKSGTTSLAYQLSQHPQICFSNRKEPGYFNSCENWRKGLKEYHALYSPKKNQLCGEASTMYTFFPEHVNTPLRIYEYNSEMKLIYIMRQPVERIISDYTHRIIKNYEKKPLNVAVMADPTYVNRSRYGLQIDLYRKYYEMKNILLLLFEEYIEDPLETLKKIFVFLDISYDFLSQIDITPKNVTKGKTYLGNAGKEIKESMLYRKVRRNFPTYLRGKLSQCFTHVLKEKPILTKNIKKGIWHLLEQDVNRVEKLIGRNIDCWRQEYC
jgi:hypothetical protein